MNLQIRLEGSATEIAEVLQALPNAAAVHAVAVELAGSTGDTKTSFESPEAQSAFVSTQFARRVLSRRRLSPKVTIALATLYGAGPTGWVSQLALCDATNYSATQLAGLMGAFGRRQANTEGYDPNASFIEYDDEAKAYRLPETVREALRTEGIVSSA